MSPAIIKLVIVTTNDLIRSGIQLLIQAALAIEIVQTFSTVQACEQYLRESRPHVLLLDDALPGYLSPHHVLNSLREASPTLRVLILSDYLSEYYVQRLIEQGASGFIYKDDHLEDTLVAGIKTVAQGHIHRHQVKQQGRNLGE